MAAEIFLIFMALIALIFASASDLKKREVPNWLSFSLIIFAFAYRAFYSVIQNDLWFFINGLIGFGIFFILAYIFYYSRVFAGGDAKLLMALGAVILIASSFIENITLSFLFIFLLLLSGSVYGVVYSIFLVLGNRKDFTKEFKKQASNKKHFIFISLALFILSLIIVYFYNSVFIVFPFIILVFPVLFIYAKAVEESCLIKEINAKDATIGDWLYEEVKVDRKTINPNWEGISEEELKLLKKSRKKVKIKYGIPFVPVFLIAFAVWIYLWQSSWSFFKFLWL